MKKKIKYVNSYNQYEETYVDNLPTVCPHCLHDVDFIVRYCELNEYSDTYNYYLKCPHCGLFSTYHSNKFHSFIAMYPISNKLIIPPKNIVDISSNFCEIFKQSQIAENNNLTEICGMGYRKALEFLIKDYLISQSPDDKEIISRETLMQSINRIDHKQIRTLAEKVAWLGNDETHYIRKHTDLDLQDLKRFLDKVIKYIDMELTTLEADTIPKK